MSQSGREAVYNPVIVALDVENRTISSTLINELKDYINFYKVGLELFLSEGIGLVTLIKAMGGKVFLDLKLHDIPNQVARACREMVRLQVDMFTVHTLGGRTMMAEAVNSVKEASDMFGLPSPKIIGVTVLTSLNQDSLKELSINEDMHKMVDTLSGLAKDSGLDGVVASPVDVGRIKQKQGQNFLVVTPGIRPEWAQTNDQKRVATPRQAWQEGADYLVIGRPIIKSDNPGEAARKILKEIGLNG